MTLKFENTKSAWLDARGPSPLYGDDFTPTLPESKELSAPENLSVLHDPRILDCLEYAIRVYGIEMMKLGYSPLTIGTYSSSAARFVQFLKFGRVIPEREQ